MARVAPIVAACVWDYHGGMEMLSVFWEAAAATDPDAPGEKGMIGGTAGDLGRVFRAAGLREVDEDALEVGAEYTGFDDWWEPFGYGIGPAGSYFVTLDDEQQAALREECRRRLGDPQGPFRGDARAWVATGTGLAHRDDGLAVGAGADERDLDLELPLDELDVRARRVGQPVVERLLPAGQRLVDGPRVVEVALVRGEVLRLRPVARAGSACTPGSRRTRRGRRAWSARAR